MTGNVLNKQNNTANTVIDPLVSLEPRLVENEVADRKRRGHTTCKRSETTLVSSVSLPICTANGS